MEEIELEDPNCDEEQHDADSTEGSGSDDNLLSNLNWLSNAVNPVRNDER